MMVPAQRNSPARALAQWLMSTVRRPLSQQLNQWPTWSPSTWTVSKSGLHSPKWLHHRSSDSIWPPVGAAQRISVGFSADWLRRWQTFYVMQQFLPKLLWRHRAWLEHLIFKTQTKTKQNKKKNEILNLCGYCDVLIRNFRHPVGSLISFPQKNIKNYLEQNVSINHC